MPELPEVETVRCGMERALAGKTISNVQVSRRDLRIRIPDDFEATMQGARIERFMRRGKYIIMTLSNKRCAVLHLGMSGRVRIYGHNEEYAAQKHDHVVLSTQGGACAVFHDPRRFGFFYTLASGQDWQNVAPFNLMGKEPLDGWGGDDLHRALSGKNTPIKNALLDQHVVAGLGNIYVCEALYQTGIDPTRAAKTLSAKENADLAHAVIDVLQRAIKAGGSSLKDYQHTDGALGYFQHGFTVYGREGESCQSKGCDQKILRIVQAARSTFYCPKCQK